MKFYQHWIGDYQKDTKRLSLLEHGAYRLLMDEYYSSEKPLPANAMQLHRICMAFASDEQEAVHVVLEQFFTLTDKGWTHGRIEEEIERSNKVSAKRRDAAFRRWDNDANADANADAKGMQKGCYPQPQPQPVLKEEQSCQKPSDSDGEKRKYDSIPYVDLVAAYHKLCPSFPKVREITDKRRKALKAGWRKYEKNPGGFPQVLDTLFKKAEASDFLTGRKDGSGGFGFDWLLKEANMVKVIEGNYDNKTGADLKTAAEKKWGYKGASEGVVY